MVETIESNLYQARLNGADAAEDKRVHNLHIIGNILRYQKYSKDDVPDGMLILRGANFKNLVLANNWIEGNLWRLTSEDLNGQFPGIVRIENNETIGYPLFSTDRNIIMPNNVITFFSGNVSNGKKTDFGNYQQQNSKYDCINFSGRYFFDTDRYQQCVFLNDTWLYSYKYT